MPFNMAHQGLNDAPLQQVLHNVLTTICPELVYTSPHLIGSVNDSSNSVTESIRTKEANNALKPAHKVLKVGFISTNFFDHSIGRILVELFILLKQQVILFDDITYTLDVYVFTIDRRLPYNTNIVINTINTTDLLFPTFHYDTDTLLHMHHDSITRILSEHLQDKAIRLPDNIHTIRKVLDTIQLDMLVFTDVGMDFSTYQLAFGRFAPYQVRRASIL